MRAKRPSPTGRPVHYLDGSGLEADIKAGACTLFIGGRNALCLVVGKDQDDRDEESDQIASHIPHEGLGRDDEQAKYAGQTLADSAHLKELHEGTAAACTDASADERNDRVAHVCSKDSGLGDSDQRRDKGRHADVALFGMLLVNEIHADGAAALGDDGNGPDGLDVVEAGRGNEISLDTLNELVRTGNDERLQERGKDEGTKDAHPVVQDIDYAGKDVANQVAERAEHGEQGDVGKNQGNGRDKDERDDLGDVLLGNLLDLGHEPGGQDCGEHAALESNHGNGERTKVPILSTRRVHNERVAVHKARMNHDDADEDT